MRLKYKILLIVFMMISLVFCFGITYSIFYSETNMNTDQRLAKFIFNTENLDILQFPLINLKPGDEDNYSFAVSNYQSGVSDVTVEYQLIIKTYHLIPLVIELYKDDELILTCDEASTRNSDNELVCTTSNITMSHTSENLDNYNLKVSFPTEYNDDIYSQLIDYIKMEIKSWQKIKD